MTNTGPILSGPGDFCLHVFYHGFTITMNTVTLSVRRDFTPSQSFCITTLIIGGLCTSSAFYKVARLIQYHCSDKKVDKQRVFVRLKAAFMQAVRLFYPQQARTLTCSDFPDWAPVANLSTMSLRHTNELSVREVDSDVQPMTFWFFK